MTDADLDALRQGLYLAALRFCEVAAELEDAAGGVAEAETALRIAAERAGLMQHEVPDVRDLCVELLHGRAAALRPWLPFVSRQGMDLAEQRLRTAPAPRTAVSGSENPAGRVPGAMKGTRKAGPQRRETAGKAPGATMVETVGT